MADFLIPKNFNYSPVTALGDYTIPTNVYNVVYCDSALDITVTLPSLSMMLQGAPILIKNFGAGLVDVVDSGTTPVTTMSSGDTLMLIADTISDEWRITLGPIGGGGAAAITGPGSSTNNAVVLWNGAGGTVVKDSSVLITGGNLITTGSGNLNLNAASGNIDVHGANLINVGTINQGAQTTLVGSRVSVTGASSVTILSITTLPGNSYSGYVNVTIVNETSATDNATYWALMKIKNIGGVVTFSLTHVSKDADTSIAGVVISTSSVGNVAQLVGTGVVATTVAFQASAYVTSTHF